MFFRLIIESVAEIDSIPNQQSWPIRLSVVDVSSESPANVLVFEAGAMPDGSDAFVAVAGPQQLTSLGIGSPNEEENLYLSSSVTLVARSKDHSTEFVQKMIASLQDLSDELADAFKISTATTTPI